MVVGQFLDWVDSAPAGRKAEAVRALARAYLNTRADSGDRAGIGAAIAVMLKVAPADIKHALADAFADSAAAPRHVVTALAADQASIAQIVLARSPLFVDAELIDVIAGGAASLQLAIACRPDLSAAVAAAIAQAGGREVCLALLRNARASLHGTFVLIAERFGTDATVRAALLAHHDLPPEVHQTLVKQVADALSAMVVARAWVSAPRATAVTREATDRATVAIATDAQATALPALVEHLRASGQLTTALMLRAVCAGNLDFFEAALATLAGVPLKRVVELVASHRLGALRALYAKAGLPQVAFEAFAAAIDVWAEVSAEEAGDDGYRTPSDVAEAILVRCAGVAHASGTEGGELTAMLRRFAADQAYDAAHQYARAAAA